MADEPTLRRGSHSPDGWVEYLQTLLTNNHGYYSDLQVTGVFDAATERVVIDFQTQKELEGRDGTVGNETWAALLGQEHAAPGHDSMGAGHVDQGLKMRFENDPWYENEEDHLSFAVFSVGTVEPAEGEVTLLIHLQGPDGSFQHETANGVGSERWYTFDFWGVTKDHAHGDYSGIAQLSHGPQVLDTGTFAFTAKGEQFIDL
jgi:hypothetical protein